MHRAFAAACILVFSSIAFSSIAQADEAADIARAARLHERGAKLVRANDRACWVPLDTAAGLDATGPILGELALCEEIAGRNAAAYEHVGRAIEKMPAGAMSREPWRRYVEAQRRLERRVARVVLSVSPQSAEVSVDGRLLGAQASGRMIAVEPGEHVWTASAPGFATASVRHTVSAGDLPPVRLDLVALPPAPATTATSTPGPLRAVVPSRVPWFVPNASPRGVFLGLTYASAAVAIVSGAVAIGLEVDHQQRRGALLGAGFDAASCSGPSRPLACAEVRNRLDQRIAARGVAIGGASGTVVFGAIAALIGVSASASKESAGVIVWGQF